MKPDSKVVTLPTANNNEKPALEQALAPHLIAEDLLDSCEAITSRHLGELLHSMLDNADDTLFNLADKAETNAIQTTYFDAMREVRVKREQIETAFRKAIGTVFHDFWSRPAKKPASDSLAGLSMDDLTLVDETELEEALAFTGMVGKARQRFAQELYAIEQRLAHVLPTREVTAENLPCGPEVICDAFRTAAGAIDTDLKIRLIVHKLFDRFVMGHLGGLYADVNALFVAAGVLPELKLKVRKIPGSGVSASASAPPPGTAPGDPALGGAVLGDDGNVFSMFQQLLAQSRPGGSTAGFAPSPGIAGGTGVVPGVGAHGTAAGGLGGGHAGGAGTGLPGGFVFAPTAEVLGALSVLQRRAPAGATGDETASVETGSPIKLQLVDALRSRGGDSGAQLAQVDNDVIDVVSMLFDFILDDRSLPASAKALLSRLQIPILKVALLDREFFAKKIHPARKLLNQLAKACLGLDDNSRPDGTNLLSKVEQIVNRVLDGFEDNVDLFAELLDELDSFLQEEREREAALQAAAMQYSQAREEHVLARKWVHQRIAERIAQRELNPSALGLITGPWRDVMLHTYLEQGDESPRWQEQLRFVDILLWSIEPKHTAQDRQRLAKVIVELLGTLRDGLRDLGYADEDIERQVHVLEALHIASVRGLQGIAVHAADNMESASESEPDSQNTGTDMDRAIAIMEQQLASLEALEAALDNGEAVYEPPVGVKPPAAPWAEDLLADEGIIEDIVLAGGEARNLAEIHDQPRDEFFETARALELGAWVEFTQDNKRRQRAKLAWKSELLGEFTFVNWKFKVVAELTLFGLAAALRRGTAQIVEDVPLLDRALDAVLSGLRRSAGTPA